MHHGVEYHEHSYLVSLLFAAPFLLFINFFEVLKDHVVTSKLRMPDTAVARSTVPNESGSLNHKMLNVTSVMGTMINIK